MDHSANARGQVDIWNPSELFSRFRNIEYTPVRQSACVLSVDMSFYAVAKTILDELEDLENGMPELGSTVENLERCASPLHRHFSQPANVFVMNIVADVGNVPEEPNRHPLQRVSDCHSD